MTTTFFDQLDAFPGWASATPFLESFIEERGLRSVADIGGGANPVLRQAFIDAHGIQHSLIDISPRELELAPAYRDKVCADVCAGPEAFRSALGERSFDLVFSHMFLEHIEDPIAAHRNIFGILRPGGYAVHLFPTANSLPLAANKLLPTNLATALLKIAQPKRDLAGRYGKFPAFYAMCEAPSAKLHAKFTALGYVVDRHVGYIGHNYYKRFPVIRDVEKQLRSVLVTFNVPLTSFALLILRRPGASEN
jgi:SAM-dependent methyltransferase